LGFLLSGTNAFDRKIAEILLILTHQTAFHPAKTTQDAGFS